MLENKKLLLAEDDELLASLLNFLPIVVGQETFSNDAIEHKTKQVPSSIYFDNEDIIIDFLPFVTDEENESTDMLECK